VDTCFLCEIGSSNRVNNGRGGFAEGFGTCSLCNVHACATHGDRSPAAFRCADCTASPGQPGQPPPPGASRPRPTDDPADPRADAERTSTTEVVVRLAAEGALGLVGISPVLGIPAWQMLEWDAGSHMREILNSLLLELRDSPPDDIRLGQLAERVLHTAEMAEDEGADVAPALGLPRREPGREPVLDPETLRQALRARADALEAEAWSTLRRTPGVLDSDEEYTDAQGEFVACAAALSVHARGGRSLRDPLVTLPGGLLLPGLTALVIALY
jgi:hypothetical protein